ncbi:MAG TPA: ferrochelatase [Candidatus Binatia bacterium]|jgi:ferrochelatase|nr:ferrochelatase [Candidatus Binatia bacterium]
MPPSYDAVLLIAFGGPTSPEEIRPFLSRVLRGHSVPSERIEEVIRHYTAVGSRSPLNEITFRQANGLEKNLKERGLARPVYVGMRNSRPFLRETLDQMTADGMRRALGFILSSHQTEASWNRYKNDVAEARAELAGAAPVVDFCPGWHSHPLFIQALCEEIRPALEKVAAEKRETTPLVFTAHSVPTAMAAESPYVSQIHETSRLVAEQIGHARWSVAYQSRSGRPTDPWLEPDISDVLRSLSNEGETEVVVAPIGFVCDHVEVLYDLDIEARKIAEGLGMTFSRASCVNDHPIFIRMMAEVIKSKLES